MENQAKRSRLVLSIFSEVRLGLSKKRRVFVEEYLKDFNGTQAAIRAGYSKNSARSTASRLLTIDNISDAIEAAIE